MLFCGNVGRRPDPFGDMDGAAVDENSVEISIVNDVSEIAGVAERIDEFREACGIGPKTAYAINAAIDEVLTNTIGYGYGDDEPHRIEIALRKEADRPVAAIADDGRAFDPSGPPPEVDSDMSLDERAVGERGLFLVHGLMDRVDYRRAGGRNFTTLTGSLAAADRSTLRSI